MAFVNFTPSVFHTKLSRNTPFPAAFEHGNFATKSSSISSVTRHPSISMSQNNKGFSKKDGPKNSSLKDRDSSSVGPSKNTFKTDIRKVDSFGISLEHKLQEELKHPLRKAKQTVCGVLTFSATLGLFFAIGRASIGADPPEIAARNIAVDVSAIVLFAWLTWTQVDFGRRAINSIAGSVEARDLPIQLKSKPKGKVTRLSSIKEDQVMILVGRGRDLEEFFEQHAVSSGLQTKLLLCAMDGFDMTTCKNADAAEKIIGWAPSDQELFQDWKSWLSEAAPSRKSLVLLKVEKGSKERKASNVVVRAAAPKEIQL